MNGCDHVKCFKRIIALFLSVLSLIAIATFSAGAITVEKDGKEYYLKSRTPTTGDCHVLMIRVGFDDYPVDDEENPADSEETLFSYFDGTEGSVNAFYEASSYGKLRLHCDQVYTYTAMFPRENYDDSNLYNAEFLISETLTALEDEIDFEKYDSDGDGYLDFVCFDYSGPMGEYASTWWPHVSTADDLAVGGKRINAYSFLRGEASCFMHEFGHLLGAEDYYSTNSQDNIIMTYDMMSNDTGDHNGFTKWSYGWLDDDDIVYVDKSSGDTTVSLAPIETAPGDGKKIAVVAPALDRSNGFLDEYFLIEYDSGSGNNAAVFDQLSLKPGFRIFHVNAKCMIYEDIDSLYFTENNTAAGINLIHNVKNESTDAAYWDKEEMFFREGDSLTPDSYPNTGLWDDGVYNGLYTGISITDFVTGEDPSFKVSFSSDPAPSSQVTLSLSYEDLRSDAEMTITSDKPITFRKTLSPLDGEEYRPYLLDKDGTKLSLTAESDDYRGYTFRLRYLEAYPTVQKNSEYTLVIPEGFFRGAYNQPVGEFRESVTTSDFMGITAFSLKTGVKMDLVQSNLFSVTDNTYGIISFRHDGENDRLTFTEYNLNGEEISGVDFDAPEYDKENNAIIRCKAVRLNDGNFALILFTYKDNYFVKIDRSGNILSDVYSVSDEFVSDYVVSLSMIDFEPYKNGIGKLLIADGYMTAAMLTIDFENPPKLEKSNSFVYLSLESDAYAYERNYDKKGHILIYDAHDQLISDVSFDFSYLCAFMEDGNIVIVNLHIDRETEKNVVYADTYSINGELLERKDITENAEHIIEYGVFNKGYPTGSGYYLEQDENEGRTIIAYDKDWNWLGSFDIENQVELAIVGECGIMKNVFFDAKTGLNEVFSRFNIGDFEIVPKREQPVLLGDVDGDGRITILDAAYIRRKLAGIPIPFGFNDTAADTDGDGNVTILDATCIQRWLAGLPSNDNIGKPII